MSRVFRPAWEVDNFEWPAAVNQLFAEQPERFDALVSLIVELADEGSRRIALVGCTPQAGGTTLSLCLARRLSEVVEKVALIDGNFRRPRLATELDACLDNGWEDVLDGDQRLEETAVSSLENGITLLPVMNAKRISGDVAAARVVQVIRRLAATHDVVLLDAGQIDPRGATPLIADGHEPAVDAAILVRDVRRSTDREVRATMAELAVQGIAAQAVAENFQTAETAERFRAAA